MGAFSGIPIHAAGVYTSEAQRRTGVDEECAADYVVSSYLPSLSSLAHLRKDLKPLTRSDATGFLAHEARPGRGFMPLDQVEEEMHRIRKCFADAGVKVANNPELPSSAADVSTSLERMEVQILHLACHGSQSKDPLKSAFILRDENLSIQDLIRLELRQTGLAFLSACETAKGSESQPDQAVHLAASMLFCGFKSVVATMWCVPSWKSHVDRRTLLMKVCQCRSMADADGPDVAQWFYESLFAKNQLDLNDVAYALDMAVHRLRTSGVPASRWAAYVHMGA
jgi:hypothetical protein